jgi:hypothetical protein
MGDMFVLLLFVLLAAVDHAVAEESKIAFWRQPRAAVVRDTLFLDGGEFGTYPWDPSASAWIQGGQVGETDLQGSGIVFALNFNQTFSVDDDFFTLFSNWTTGPGSTNPPFRSGFMFADDYEFYTYG